MEEENQRSRNLPHGWLACHPFGQEIAGIIIPSKTPLNDSFTTYIPPGLRYSFRQVVHQQRVLGRTLGLVIDLTNTSRYYSQTDLRHCNGIKYVKIPCRGRDCLPDNASVNRFVHEINQFKYDCRRGFIFVHSTHGYNRAGYMIAHYLMRSGSVSVTEAIKLFAQARPPGIFKLDYIDALYTFYHERKPEAAVCPAMPDWMRDGEDEDEAPSEVLIGNNNVNLMMSKDDILGDEIPSDQQELYRQFCYTALKLQFEGRVGDMQFPGSHPVSLNRDNLQLLRNRYYQATWKADGTRYMMLITMDGCYLVDVNFNFQRVQMRFPCRNTTDHHHYTLLDGKMVIDAHPDDSKKQERRYYIYDLMAINHISVVDRPFHERWMMIEKEVIAPRNDDRKNIIESKNPCYRYELEPFRIRRTEFWHLSTARKLLKEFIPKLCHKADGMIFQCLDDPYVPSMNEELLKWKNPEMKSVNFLFEVDNNQKELLYLHEGGKKKLMEGNTVKFKDGSNPSSYSGRIVECLWDSEEQVWVFLQIRADKSTPNEFNTFEKVMQSMNDSITEEVLFNELDNILRLPIYVDGIRNDAKRRRRW